MSCYLRHLRAELQQVGINLDEDDRKKLDQAIHRAAGVGYKDCPKTWNEVKKQMTMDKKSFMVKVKKEFEGD
jgi:hypothetical protein